MGPVIGRAARDYLRHSFAVAPPGYSNAARLLTRSNCQDEEGMLFTQVQDGPGSILLPSQFRKRASEFDIATHLNRSLFNLR